jgi:hypothetical protein
MTHLAAWPRGTFREVLLLAQNELAHAAKLLHAPRVLMFWEEPEEPWMHLAVWSHDAFHLSREPPTRSIGWLPSHSSMRAFQS